MQNIIALYEEYLKISGHAIRGIEDLKKSIYRFFDYLEAEGLELTDINVSNAHLYQKRIRERNRASIRASNIRRKTNKSLKS